MNVAESGGRNRNLWLPVEMANFPTNLYACAASKEIQITVIGSGEHASSFFEKGQWLSLVPRNREREE